MKYFDPDNGQAILPLVVNITGALTINQANAAGYNGRTLVFASAQTVSLGANLPIGFGFTIIPPASGNASIAIVANSGVTLNGAGTTVTRAVANIAAFVIQNAPNSFVITGS